MLALSQTANLKQSPVHIYILHLVAWILSMREAPSIHLLRVGGKSHYMISGYYYYLDPIQSNPEKFFGSILSSKQIFPKERAIKASDCWLISECA